MQFLIIHGSFGSPESNWFSWLRNELEATNQTVLLPRFPVDDWNELTKRGEGSQSINQNLANWLNVLSNLINQIKTQPTCVVAHSIGPLFILHAIEKYNIKFESGIFVAPFLTKLNKSWQIDSVNRSFYSNQFNWDQQKTSLPISYAIYSDNDPYVDTIFPQTFAQKLGSQVINSKTGGHFNSEFGFTQFPLVFELCKTRIGK